MIQKQGEIHWYLVKGVEVLKKETKSLEEWGWGGLARNIEKNQEMLRDAYVDILYAGADGT